METDKQKIVIIAYGGAMAGVYAAGVFSELEKNNYIDKIEALYGASAGLQACAFFLTGETEKGSTIYWEELNNHKYIKPLNFIKYFFHVITGKTTKNHLSTGPLFDIHKFEKIEKNKIYLNIPKLKENKIPWFATVYSLKNQKHLEISMLENLDDLEQILLASTGGQPGYPLTQKCLSEEVLDGDLIYNQKLIADVCNKYPSTKILCIISDPAPQRNYSLNRKFSQVVQYILNRKLYGKEVAIKSYVSKNKRIDEKKYLKKYSNLKLLINPIENQQLQRSADKLRQTWELGRNDLRKLILKGDL